MIRARLSRSVLAVLCGLALAGGVDQAHADNRPFDIPPGELKAVLEAYSRQSGVRLIYRSDDVAGVHSAGLVGTLPVEEAIARLLDGTDLVVERDASGAIAVVRRSSVPTTPSPPTSRPTPERGASAPPRRPQAVGAPLDAPAPGGLRELGTVEVTGTRLRGGIDDGPSPVTVFDRQHIERLGAASVTDLLRYLPQQPFSQAEGQSFAQLRGLSTDATVVLINGRRVPRTPSAGTFNAVELSSLPLAAIERVEVLLDSASAVYGADAVGGVINIILKNDPRPSLDLRYGGARGGADERRATLNLGHASERFHGSLLLDHYRQDTLLGNERERRADQDYRRYGDLDRRVPTASPGNVTSLLPGNLPGLPAPFAAVPAGSSGVGMTPADFLATAGQRNLVSLGQFDSIVPESRHTSVTAMGELDLTPRTTAYGELQWQARSRTTWRAPSTFTLPVPATHPFNPFGVPVISSFMLSTLGQTRNIIEADAWRAVAGLKGHLQWWDWEVSLVRADEDSDNWTANAADPARVAAALANPDPTQTLNVFQDGPGGSAALLASLINDTPPVYRHVSSLTQVSALLRGPLWRLPAGDLDSAFGLEWGEESLDFDQPPTQLAGDRRIQAAFAELRVPLVDPARRIAGVHQLTLKLEGRYDRYSDFGSSFNPKLGLNWSVNPVLMLRGAYSTSFSPPAMFVLHQPSIEFPVYPIPVLDPRRNNEPATVGVIAGGNPHLSAVEGETWTAGIVLTPQRWPGWRISAGYFDIRMDNRVAAPQPDQLLAAEALFPERIRRAEPTPADIAAGLPGRVTFIDLSRINAGRLQTSGVDWEAAYAVDTAHGRFSSNFAGTWTRRSLSADFPGVPVSERVGLADVLGAIPEWKAAATLAWSPGPLDLSATVRYVHSMRDASIVGTSWQPNGRILPAQTLLDLQGALNLSRWRGERAGWLRGARLAVGIVNVFDREPPFSAAGFDRGYAVNQGDLIGRSGYLTLSKEF